MNSLTSGFCGQHTCTLKSPRSRKLSTFVAKIDKKKKKKIRELLNSYWILAFKNPSYLMRKKIIQQKLFVIDLAFIKAILSGIMFFSSKEES